jgi:hypothetical protein
MDVEHLGFDTELPVALFDFGPAPLRQGAASHRKVTDVAIGTIVRSTSPSRGFSVERRGNAGLLPDAEV